MGQADDETAEHLGEIFGGTIPESLLALLPDHRQDR
jgi:hypothetical protein